MTRKRKIKELREAEAHPRGLLARLIWPGAEEYARKQRAQEEGSKKLKKRYGGCEPLY